MLTCVTIERPTPNPADTTSINLAAGTTIVPSMTLGAALNVTGTGRLVVTGPVTLQADLTINASADLVFEGAVTANTGNYTLTKTGLGTLTLAGSDANSFGGSDVTGGTLLLAKGGAVALPANLRVDGPATVRLLRPNQLAAGSTVMLNGAIGNAVLDLNGQPQTIGALGNTIGGAVELGGATLTLDNSAGSSFSGQIQGLGMLVKQGSGTLTLAASALQGCGLSVAGGQVVVSGTTASRVASLDLKGGTLNLGDSTLLIDYGSGRDPIDRIRSYIVGDVAPLTGASLPLGYGDSADGLVSGLPANTVVVKPTLAGDANLDGKVDFVDLLVVAQHYNGTQAAWTRGDFNGDGIVNFADLLVMAQNYGKAKLTGAVKTTGAASRRRPLR